MNIRRVSEKITCPKCGEDHSALLRVQGQTEGMCPDCLVKYASQQGVDKNVTLDGGVIAEDEQ